MIGLFRLVVFMVVVDVSLSQYPFGGGRPCGGGCAPPMCPPRMPCSAPMPMPVQMPICPPPPPCPAQFCPPPPICPPPPPPMPCPLPPPPPPRPACPCMSRPSFYPTYMPQYYQQPMPMPQPIQFPAPGGCGGGGAVVPSVRIPAQNDCCCGCSSPCRYKSVRRAAFAAKTVDPSCNSEDIKTIILDNISEDASESKRKIQKAAEEALGFDINVICGNGEFSYIAHTDTFCQTSKEDITCYAFKPL